MKGRYDVWWHIHRRPLAPVVLRLTSAVGVAGAVLSLVFLALRLGTADLWLLTALLPLAVGFLLLTYWRARKNAPRPYELYDFSKELAHRRRGCSFPSRHAFSAFAIATAVFAVSVPVGCMAAALALLQALVRFLLGLHFPRDLLVGAAVGVLVGGMSLAVAGALPYIL